jgi:tRNA threonylcarbamoyladenosine biosynthesis protein TsaB
MLVRPDRLPDLEGSWHGCGSGFSVQAQALAEAYRLSGSNPRAVPRAAAIARLAARDFAAGSGIAPEQAVPVYLRDKVALNIQEQVAARAARSAT